MPKITWKQKIGLILFGVALSLVIIDIIFRAGGFIYLTLKENRNRIALSKGGEYRILFLGESTTAEGGWDSYPRKVGRILEKMVPGTKFSVINKGTPGVDTTYLLSRLKDNLKQYNPNIVVAMMGINDQVADVAHGGRLNRGIEYVKRLRLYKLLKVFSTKIQERDILKEIYIARAHYYQEKDDYMMAERLFNKVIEIKPKEYDAYIEFARYYLEREDYFKAEEFFSKAVQTDPQEYVPYLEYGRYWMERQDYSKSEEMFKKALDLSGNSYRAFIELGQCYNDMERFADAREMFRKALESNTRAYDAHLEFGRYLLERQAYAEAETLLKELPKIDPDNEVGYRELGWCYAGQGRLALAEEMFKKAIEIAPGVDIVYTELARFYEKEGRKKEAQEVIDKVVEKIRSTDDLSEMTRRNYRKLAEIVLGRGIKLVCVQYPRRPLKPLKRIFKSIDKIKFVDNEKTFKEAIREGMYEDYFVDRFAGDFGHFTDKGADLLAKNVAEVIIKEYFSIQRQ